MNSILRGVLAVLAVVALGCTSTPQKTFDVAQAADKKFVLTSVSLLVRTDFDKEGQGKNFLKAQYASLGQVMAAAAKDKGVEIDTAAYDQAVQAGTVVLKQDDLKLSADFSMTFYHWTVASAAAQTATFTVTFAPHDGVLPATLDLYQQDPAAPQKPFAYTVPVDLRVE